MTIKEAIEQRIPRIRKPIWGYPNAYLRLTYTNNDVNIWTQLYSRDEQEAANLPTPQEVLITSLYDKNDNDYILYEGEIDKDDVS